VSKKRFIPHRFAAQDEEKIVQYYEQMSSEQIALGFINALDQAFSQLSRYPQMGSPRPEYDLELEGIRSWSLKNFLI
jgi:toxin ParE1/3/4